MTSLPSARPAGGDSGPAAGARAALVAAADELKTPMTILRASARAMLHRLRSTGTLDRHLMEPALVRLEEQASRLSLLVDRLLLALALDDNLPLDRRPEDLAALARRLVAEPGTTGGHPVVVRTAAAVPVRVDASRLELALSVAIEDAIRRSRLGQPVEIEIGRAAGGEARLTITAHVLGAPPAYGAPLFAGEALHKEATVGAEPDSGIGPYVCRRIVELHGGRVETDVLTAGVTGVMRVVVTLPSEPTLDTRSGHNLHAGAGDDRSPLAAGSESGERG